MSGRDRPRVIPVKDESPLAETRVAGNVILAAAEIYSERDGDR